MKVLMLFLDGVGIGVRDPVVNPFFAASLPFLRSMFDGELPSLRHRTFSSQTSMIVPLDANLGIPGLPQSGTGQTALFTGVNGAAVVGRHFGPHPYSTLRPIIEQKNIFRLLSRADKNPCFANVFPQRFFDYIDQKRSRLSVTSFSCISCGVPLLRAPDLVAGKGVSADITGAGWKSLGHPEIVPVSPEEAGRRLARLTESHDFVLFEYWRTDQAGHTREMTGAVSVLETFDGFLGGILDAMDRATTLLIITSDHGNIEDLTIKTHTRHPVPLVLHGYHHREFAAAVRNKSGRMPDLTVVTPTIMKFMVGEQRPIS